MQLLWPGDRDVLRQVRRGWRRDLFLGWGGSGIIFLHISLGFSDYPLHHNMSVSKHDSISIYKVCFLSFSIFSLAFFSLLFFHNNIIVPKHASISINYIPISPNHHPICNVSHALSTSIFFNIYFSFSICLVLSLILIS